MKSPQRWRRLLGGLLDAALPPRCLACSTALGPGRPLCPPCAAELPLNRCACRGCALPLASPGSLSLCGRCLRRAPPYQSCRAVFVYRDPVDRWLGGLKFSQDLAAGRLLAAALADAYIDSAAAPLDAIVPMPLHAERLRERGYNQAQELCRLLPAASGLALRPELLSRQRATTAQLGLNAGQRRRNLRGAFAASAAVRGLRLLLVDDVITTGSSIGEASRCLLAAGALEVHVMALARVPRGEPR